MTKLKKYSIYFAFFANLAVTIGFWAAISGQLFLDDTAASILLAFGRLSGLLSVYFVLIQFLLMGRAPWIEKIFGLDKLARIHRLNGYLSISFIIIHPILVTASYAISDKVNFFAQFMDFIRNYDSVLASAIAVVIFILIVFLSIYIVRKHLKYELWYFIHLLTYLAVILAFLHQIKLGGDLTSNIYFNGYWLGNYIFVFGNVLLFRFMKPVYSTLKFSFVVDEIVQETSDTTSVYITGKNLQGFKTKPGQFIIVRFLCKGLWWEAHPFSLSFIPKNNRLRLTIKNCGDFTSKIPQIKKGTRMYIDGPYGIFTALTEKPGQSGQGKPSQKIKYLLIAGGVGITPIRSLIEQLSPKNDVILLYGSRTLKDIIFKKELDEIGQNFHCPIHYILSDQAEYEGEKGRIDKEKLNRLVKDIQEREIYLCGPILMMNGILQLLKTEGIRADHLHFEKFSL